LLAEGEKQPKQKRKKEKQKGIVRGGRMVVTGGAGAEVKANGVASLCKHFGLDRTTAR